MSRTKHTRPAQIIAAERVRAPRGKRSDGELSVTRQTARALKELGITISDSVVEAIAEPRSITFPRFTVQRPRSGYLHAANKRDITKLLLHFGELTWYGVREITLMQNPDFRSDELKFGALSVPGKILLYEQPEPPWICTGVPVDSDILQEAGAVITISSDRSRSRVDWTRDALRDFMLFDVLMHEIGHHLIQQFSGKRIAQVKRTKDHERAAMNFARRCRESYMTEGSK